MGEGLLGHGLLCIVFSSFKGLFISIDDGDDEDDIAVDCRRDSIDCVSVVSIGC